MAEDKLSFLDEEPEGENTPEPKTEKEPVEVEAEADAEAPPVEEPEDKGEEDAAPPAAEPDAKHIPVTALLDEREKRQAAQREAEEARKKAKELEDRLRALETPEEQPDFYTDPDAAFAARERQWEQKMLAQRLTTSRFLAEREHGAELVNEAYAYFDQHPQESQMLLQHPSPFHAAVEHYKRQKFLSEVQDPEAWKEEQLAQLREQLAQEAQTATPPKPRMPPASLASAPSAGGDPKSPGTAFDEVFG